MQNSADPAKKAPGSTLGHGFSLLSHQPLTKSTVYRTHHRNNNRAVSQTVAFSNTVRNALKCYKENKERKRASCGKVLISTVRMVPIKALR